MATQPSGDKAWWDEFQAAPEELREAMNATRKARNVLAAITRWQSTPDGMLSHAVEAQKKMVARAERHEARLRSRLARK